MTLTVTTKDEQPDSSKPPSRLKTCISRTFSLILGQWLLIGIGLACVIGYFFPNVAKHGGTIRSEYSILYGAVGIIFFVSGLSIPGEKLLVHLRNWRLHLLVQATSYLFFPAFMLAIVHLILATDRGRKIDVGVLAGYVFTACLPTTISSNVVMTRAAGGDDAAALVEVLIANVLGPFISPGWTIALLPHSAEFAPWVEHNSSLGRMYQDVFRQLGISVLAPLAVGLVIRRIWTKQSVWFLQTFYVQKISTACLILLMWASFSTCFATNAFETITPECVAFIVLFNIALYLFMTVVCFSLCRPPERLPFLQQTDPRITIAVCFCGPAKTTGLGIPLLYAMWESLELGLRAKTSLPVLLYTTEQVFVAHFIVYIFKMWLRKKATKESSEGGQESV